MIYEVEISEQAASDLRAVFEYIAFSLLSVQNAIGQLERLEDKIMKLNQMPERFQEYEKKPWHSRGLRAMPVDNYCVFYIPNEQRKTVTIIRVMYGGRDIDLELKEHTKI